jgi:hypothetical protein
MRKNTVQPDRPQMTMQYGACWTPKASKHKLRIRNTYSFSTAAIVSRTRPYVTLYIHCMTCLMLYPVVYKATIKVQMFNNICRKICEDVNWMQIHWESRCSLNLMQPQQPSRQQIPSPAADATVRNRVYAYCNIKTRINKPPRPKREAGAAVQQSDDSRN